MPLTIPLFVLSQIIYWFLLYYPSEQPSVAALVVKCLPVASLALSIFVQNSPKTEENVKVGHISNIWSIFILNPPQILVQFPRFLLSY